MLRVSTALGDRRFDAFTSNISVGGAFIQTGQQVFPKGAVVPLEFKMPEDCEGSITAVGEVVRIVRKTGYHGNVPGFALRWISIHVKGHPDVMTPLLIRYFGAMEGLPVDEAFNLSRTAAITPIQQDVQEVEDQTAPWQKIRALILKDTPIESDDTSEKALGITIPDTLSQAKSPLELVAAGLPMDLKVTYRIQSVSHLGTLKLISTSEVYVVGLLGGCPGVGSRLRLPIRIDVETTTIRATLLCTVEEVDTVSAEKEHIFRASVFNIDEEGSPGVLEAYLTHEARIMLKKES